MVKKMIVVLSAMALIIVAVGAASAQMMGMMPGCATTGDMITIPMKVKTTILRDTAGTAGGDSTLMLDGCEQYTGGFRPWGVWKGTKCAMKVQVIPPKCVAPCYGGPVAWGAPPAIPAGSKLVSNVEKYSVKSPGCNPCVTPGLTYEMIKKQAVK
jgi:hypothetical protein